jgi:carbamoyl-phosphate synthase small subunit
MENSKIPAVILLKDGTVFHGNACGAIGTTTGEIAFNTGMTGYQEIFTDPSYFGQILVMATSHIGNYGVVDQEVESDSCKIRGLVVKKFAHSFSRYRESSSLQDFLVNDNIVGIKNIDTRALVTHIRENGAQNAIISSESIDIKALQKQLNDVPSMKGLGLAEKVSCAEPYEQGEGDYRVALIDYGVKRNIIRCLLDRGCKVKVFPFNVSYEEIMEYQPDGIMLSNGPGDPEPLLDSIETVKKLVQSGIPIFGICLGHQILSLSQGLKTEKMHNGHRGINHPVKNIISGKCEVTSQNHGFVVSKKEAENHPDISITHMHLNDDTVAGIAINSKPVFSVQYHPEASSGPHDSRHLFDQFISNIKKHMKQPVSS